MIHGNEFGAVEETHQSRIFVLRSSAHILETANVVRRTLVDIVDEWAELTETRPEGPIGAETSNDENGENGAEIHKRQNANHGQRTKNKRERDT